MTRESIARLIDIVAQILYVLILARIVVSWIGLNPWNPIVRWLRIIVDPVLRPFRRVLPTFGGIDFSPLLAILVIFFIDRVATTLLYGSTNIAGSVAGLVRDVIINIIIVLSVLVLIRFLLSLFNADPWHPLVAGVRSMTNFLVAPFSGIGRRGHLRNMYSHQRAIDVPALLTLALFIVIYFAVRLFFDRVVLAA